MSDVWLFMKPNITFKMFSSQTLDDETGVMQLNNSSNQDRYTILQLVYN